jgi:copper chaperone
LTLLQVEGPDLGTQRFQPERGTMKLRVEGMSCEHCVRTVREAVRKVAPGAEVRVDLASGTVEVTGPADRNAVEAAIRDAGYEVTRGAPAGS